MAQVSSHPSDTVSGTIGGTLLTIMGMIDYGDIVKTTVLATVGAVVSFSVSAIMQSFFPKKKDR